MKKFILGGTVILLLQSTSYAVDMSIKSLPKQDLKIYNSLSPDKQADVLRQLNKMGYYDPEHTRLDQSGHFYVVDDPLDKIMKDNNIEVPQEKKDPKKDVISDTLPTGSTKDGVPILHSFPGSPNVIYLKFTGETITGRAWNDNYNNPIYIAQPFAPIPFKAADVQKIIQIWARVTEHYAPWQIDVTTEAPRSYTKTTVEALITKSITADGKPMPFSGGGGVAYLDIFNYSDAYYYGPALIYSNKLAENNPEAVAEATAHELGHTFGLSHNSTKTSPYWGGMGGVGGELSWGCVMGVAYWRSITKFCDGNYPDATNKERQVQIINEHAPVRSPSAGNSIATATPLPISNNAFIFSGIIENYLISDYFLLSNIQDTLKVDARTYRAKTGLTVGNSLCLAVQIFDASGKLLNTTLNPNSCSVSVTLNSLPFGNYYIRVYPVGNPGASIPLYGSMGQYDLTGTVTVTQNTFSITPQYKTLALNAKLSFDAYETVQVSNGTPPYKYTSTLNPFTQSGNTYTYTATRPGLDTIIVTDSQGKTASAQITVSYMDFGGMYGSSKIGNYNNPLTNTFGCPSGYISRQVMGTTNLDYPLYYCYRMHANGVPAQYDFGGIYSYSSSGVRPNIKTNAASCPVGYSVAQVFGESSNSPDYPVYFCYKNHDESIAEALPFAAMYAPAAFTSYTHPITNTLACPQGMSSIKMLDTYYVDYAFYYCSFASAPLKLILPFSTLGYNNTIIFSANDTTNVTGGAPPYQFKASFGRISQVGNNFVYTASKLGVDTITVIDSQGNTASSKLTVGFVDFGGMYGYSKNKTYKNPITGTTSCPSGYTSQQIMGSNGIDNPLFYCYRIHSKGVPADYDFGGIFSNSASGPRVNPLTGATSCPANFRVAQVYSDTADVKDNIVIFCYKTHDESIEEIANFGGMFAPALTTQYNNPVTQAQSCPSFTKLSPQMLGTTNIDYPFYFCY